MSPLSLVSLNIERSKHLDRVIPFLEEQQPDVFCAQELFEADISLFRKMFKFSTEFVPLSFYVSEIEGNARQGVCIFSNVPILNTKVLYYSGTEKELPRTVFGDATTYNKGNRAVLFATLEKDGNTYTIGTTHFTWSEKGQATDTQRGHLNKLLSLLKDEKEFILCGDFNMPRGGELFSVLVEKYKDNIPSEYKTSIDVPLHRSRLDDPEELATKMVDGLFTTPEYQARDVRLVSGVSDHMAIVAIVNKA